MASKRRLRPQASSRPVRSPHWRADGQPKARYRSEQEANRAAFGYRLDHGVDLAAYVCPLCGGWHLANTSET